MSKRIFVIAIILMMYCMGTYAQGKSSKSKKEDKQDTAKKKVTILEKTKGSRKIPGMFTLYQDTATGSLQLLLKKEQLKKEFIYQSFSMGGPPELFLNQNMIRYTMIFSARKSFDKIEFFQANTNYYYDPKNAISKSANVDVSDAQFFSEKIAAEDSTGYLINVDGLLLSEKLDPVRPFLPPSVPPNTVFDLGTLNKDKSSYLKIRSFPKNTDVVVSLAYENPKPVLFGGKDITDARYVQVKMQHSFIEVPQADYKPRYDDPRIGYFTQEVNDMTSTEWPFYKDQINRWNLKKKDPSAPLSEPVEPIVWWVENTTPVEIRQVILEAGQKWNEPFEKAGFKNAVVMKMMPDTATWDPADIRYNVIRWVSSDLGYAIGPSFVNPRTGQILGSDITIDYGLLFGGVFDEELYQAFGKPSVPFYPGFLARNCFLGPGLKAQQAAATAFVETFDALSLERLKDQFITELVLHEMGHTFGLNHNMKSSHMLSPQELANIEITRKSGVMGSVMDYSAVNLVWNDGKPKPIDYYSTKPGPYDIWAIEYGYSTYPSVDEEKAGLMRILSRSNEPQLTFGNDADITRPGGGIDPRVCTWDMSNDPVTYAEDRFKIVNKTLAALKDKFVKPGKSYEKLTVNYSALQWQRISMSIAVSHYVGGVFVDRSFPEQQSPTKPFTPVSMADQKKAMAMLSKYLFAPNAFDADAQLFPYLQRQRRGFNFFGSTEDPKPQRNFLAMQSYVLDFLLHPVTLQRISTSTLYGNTYSVSDVIGTLNGAIFDADWNSDVTIVRQNIQMEYVHRLGAIVNDSDKKFDTSSKSAAYYGLTSLRTKLKTPHPGNQQTQAHRSNLAFLIDKSLSVYK